MWSVRSLLPAALFLALTAAAGIRAAEPAPESEKPDAPRSRTFLFTYAATITGLPEGKVARVWLPVPPSNDDQETEVASKKLPAEGHIAREPRYGNHILYFEAPASAEGSIACEATYRVIRHEVKAARARHPGDKEKLAPYLQPDVKVPIDGKPLELIKDKNVPKDQVAAARMFYDVVNGHMRYSKEGTGWGRGDSVWACASGYGNCSDFHSLFISLARSQKIPAKFEIGFPLPDKRGAGDIPGYHCWAKFRPAGRGWIPVDISEANKNPKMRDYYFGNLTEHRVAFSTGRDLDLVPKQDGPPLNFFIYPYVEVDGKPYPADKIGKEFSFKDLSGNGH